MDLLDLPECKYFRVLRLVNVYNSFPCSGHLSVLKLSRLPVPGEIRTSPQKVGPSLPFYEDWILSHLPTSKLDPSFTPSFLCSFNLSRHISDPPGHWPDFFWLPEVPSPISQLLNISSSIFHLFHLFHLPPLVSFLSHLRGILTRSLQHSHSLHLAQIDIHHILLHLALVGVPSLFGHSRYPSLNHLAATAFLKSCGQACLDFEVS